ncbi:enhanced intracellular survival protein Eis [uncultured Veillonella sp.]|uniref:GNAT family N-acetyltransferase n=1 Tax=uncultured Veillonella sp. TaxID=159268 RepID=UPI0025FB0766|nr:GNAT family N-acetyltransferase [uncultured Veillonella sp.]MDY3974513.1 GNAT family N-acetyltransferase [Veillonella caviae]
MEFRIAKESDTRAVKRLWDYCFETEDTPFFKYYFEKAYEPEHTLVGYEGDLLASMVHLRQYNINVRGAVIPMSYMVGVATDPVARRGGIGGRLLTHALEDLRRRKQGLTILMPSKAAFYQQYGWDLYAHQWVQTLPLEELRPLTDKTMEFGLIQDVSEWPLLAPVYEAYTKHTSGYAVRGEKEWTRLLESLFAEGVRIAYVRGPVEGTGHTEAVQDEGPIEGYAMYRLGASEIPVTEFIYSTRRAQRGLLNYFYNHRSQGETLRWNEGLGDESYIFHPDGKTGHTTMPYMMSRIVDVSLAIEQVPAKKEAVQSLLGSGNTQFKMRVLDTMAQWNDGIFQFSIGEDQKVVAQPVDEAEAQGLEGTIPTITVGGLGLILMGRMTASQLVFEGKLTVPAGCDYIVEALDALYPKQTTFINEWW